MSEKLEITNGKVDCPKTGATQRENLCVHCDYCRIVMYDYVKCNFADATEQERRSAYIW